MKRIASWLEAKLSRSSSVNSSDTSSGPERTKPGSNDLDLPKDMQDMVDDVTVPGKGADEDDVTVPDLHLDDRPSSDSDTSTGFNPYDTATLRKK